MVCSTLRADTRALHPQILLGYRPHGDVTIITNPKDKAQERKWSSKDQLVVMVTSMGRQRAPVPSGHSEHK